MRFFTFKKKVIFDGTQVQEEAEGAWDWDDPAAQRVRRPEGRVGNKKPTQKNPPKKPTKNVFCVFLGF